MPHDIICFTSRYSVGVTFLLWSYHWLCGHETYYRMEKGRLSVPSNPNTGLNAHNFDKNIHAGLAAWQESIAAYQRLKDQGPIAFYGCAPQSHGDASDKEYGDSINYATESGIPVVLVLESESDPYYFSKVRRFDNHTRFVESRHGIPQYIMDTLGQYFSNQYYHDVIDRDDMKLWDLREFIALNYENIFLQQTNNYKKYIDFARPHLCIDSKQLWHDGENCLRHVMAYLGESIDESRWANWLEVYHTWRNVHLDVLRFGWNLSHVVDAIVNGYDYDLTPLNLDLLRESIIQGHLIKDHGLNLKTWNLDRFPSNTKDLHVLLEPLTNQ